jgi:hypothetical protein
VTTPPEKLRDASVEAYQGVHSSAARTVLEGVIGDPYGFVTALSVEYQSIGPTFALTVFTDGDLHLGVQIYTDGRDPLVGFVSKGTDGKWTFLKTILSLSQMGQFVGTVDTDPNS